MDMMDQCDKCMEKQKWLLETNDGSQVVCTCADRFSEGDAEEPTAAMPSTVDNETQTPKGVLTAIANVDAPKRKMRSMEKFWMNPGHDIRRNLFKDYNWRKMEEVKDRRWAILKIENIVVSPYHRCTRRFYLGDADGCNYLEIEFYPCIPYKDLNHNYKEQFHMFQKRDHGLSYNPIRRALPCKMAVSKINDYIVHNDIDIILYSDGPDNKNGRAELEMCKELGIPSLNIYGISHNCFPPSSVQPPPVFEKELDTRQKDCIFEPPFHEIKPADDGYTTPCKRFKSL